MEDGFHMRQDSAMGQRMSFEARGPEAVPQPYYRVTLAKLMNFSVSQMSVVEVAH
jgi:hypothetical protein